MPRTPEVGKCDVCGKQAVDRCTGEKYSVQFCRECGTDLTLFQVLEHKYGYVEAQRLLRA